DRHRHQPVGRRDLDLFRVPGHVSRAAATAAVLLVVVFLLPISVGAASLFGGRETGSGAVTSGEWSARLSSTSMTFTSDVDQASTVANTGTLILSAISYQVTVSKPASGAPTFKIFVCTVAWSGGTCSGGPGTKVGGTFAKNSSTTVSSTVVPAVAGDVYLQVEPASAKSTVTVTLGTSITSPAQLRPPVETDH
ncbi:MAG: hypothetical protein ACRDYE_15110, partial [Acidimicrobiales bacterium]